MKNIEVAGVIRKIGKVNLSGDWTKALSFSPKGDVVTLALPYKIPDEIADVITIEYLP